MSNSAIESEIEALRLELKRLNDHRFIRIQNSVPKLLGLQFLRGLALGLGTVVGATILVTFLVHFLTNIDFIPIIGEWAAEIAAQMKATQ